MRRTTPHCTFVAREQQRLLRALTRPGVDLEAVARTLEAFVTPERAARLRSVFAARVGSVTAVMDSPHDPHNGAAVIRSCDAFGVPRLHVVEAREAFLVSNTVSRGSERWVELRTYASTPLAVEAITRAGYELVATHPEGELAPEELASVPKLALVLGNERHGIGEELGRACARSVRIPMRGFAESLNVSVTAAILLQHATSGRPGDLSAAEQVALYARALVLTVPHAPEVLAARGVAVGGVAVGGVAVGGVTAGGVAAGEGSAGDGAGSPLQPAEAPFTARG